MNDILTFPYEPARSRYARYRLDPVFERTPDGAVIGIIRYASTWTVALSARAARTHSVTISSTN